MKLSKNTLSVLKNFSTINPSIYLRKGSIIATKSFDNVIYAESKIEDIIDDEVGIYDVAAFLSIMNLFTIEDVEVTSIPADLEVLIKDKRSSVSYTVGDPSTIVYPSQYAKFPVASVHFELSEDNLERLMKASSTLGLSEIHFASKDDKIIATAVDPKDDTANTYQLEMGDYDGTHEFNYVMKVSNMKMVKGSYHVQTYRNQAMKFENDTYTYIIAAGSTSTFA